MPSLRIALGLLAVAPIAGAEPFSADRPGVADPPEVVGRGVVQIEAGVVFERESDAGEPVVNTVAAPDLLLRYGLLESLELRVALAGYVHDDRSGLRDRSSVSDVELGGRLRVFDQRGARPAAALALAVRFPTGSSAVTSDGFDPAGALLLGWSWAERWGLDANLGLGAVSQGVDQPRHVFELAPAVSLGVSLAERWGLFVEYYGNLLGRGVGDEHAIDGGCTWQPRDDLQIDLSAGAGLNDAAPDLVVSAGVAWRFSGD
jgi:hypothetical protein